MHVGAVDIGALGAARGEEASADIRKRVVAARARQRERYVHLGGVRSNAEAPGRWLVAHGSLTSDACELLDAASARLGISARGFHRAVRVARTIADLDGAAEIGASAMAEALRYRPAATAAGT
ncbi:MAG TPA: hypothetical protein VG916_08995 [Gemmatimonadaceae bacterium]|nr:hypothetical protein [Gemmatimonadaceae bacterium]